MSPPLLRSAANVLDERAEAKRPDWGRQEGGFEDGYISVAPVGSFGANGFGLFDMHGNVWEWCRDGFGHYTEAVRELDGLRSAYGEGALDRVTRGGGFNFPASYARSSCRYGSPPTLGSNDLGVRAARNLH